MKKHLLIIAIGLLVKFEYSHSQPDPINIQFVEAQPIWENLTADTNFYVVNFQPDINKYTVVRPHKSFRIGNDLFILNACKKFNSEDWGYILKKLDIKSGEVLWENYSTYYNNQSQDYFKNLYLRPDGNLEMIGVKRHGLPFPDSIFYGWNFGGGQSNLSRKIFDYNNGELIEEISSTDSLSGIIPRYLSFYSITFDSEYLYLHQTGHKIGQDIVWGYDFYRLGGDQNILDTLSYAQIIYETAEPAGYFTYGNPPLIEYLDDTTMVALFFRDRLEPDLTKAQLLWIDIKDLNNIFVRKRMQIEHLLPGMNDDFLFFNFYVQNRNIIITQPYFDDEIIGYISYLTIIDQFGNIKHHLRNSRTSDFVYEGVVLIYTSNSFDYYAAFPSKTGREGMDILQLFHDSDTLHYVSSLTSAVPGEEFTRQMEVSKLYEDGMFIIGAYTKKVGPEQNSAVKFYAFNAHDLGMELITSTKEINNNNLVIYPNPSTGDLTMRFNGPLTGKVFLFDLNGRLMIQMDIKDEPVINASLDMLPPGLYLIKILNENDGTQMVSKLSLIK